MKKTNDNLILLNVIFCISLVVANVVTSKIINTGIPWFGGGSIMIPGAALVYAVTFLMTDVIGEIWGRGEANKTVVRGLSRRSSLRCLSSSPNTSRVPIR